MSAQTRKVVVKVEPAPVGVSVKGQEVIKVAPDSQAARAGVELGWSIVQIGGKTVSNSKEITAALGAGKNGGKKYEIVFMAPQVAVGSSAHMDTRSTRLVAAHGDGPKGHSDWDVEPIRDYTDGTLTVLKCPKCPEAHALKFMGTRQTGWACSMYNTYGGLGLGLGCKRGCTDFHQSSDWGNYNCAVCDYNLCDYCYEHKRDTHPGHDIVEEKQDTSAQEIKKTTDISKDQLWTYQEDFNKFDVNGSGALDLDEVKQLLKHQLQDRDPTQDELDDFMSCADLNADGQLSLHEYISSMLGGAWTVDGKPHDQLAWYKVSGAPHAIWKSCLQLISSASELEARAIAGLEASGKQHAKVCQVSDWDIEPKHLAGMFVQVQKVYMKHAYVRDADGTQVWVPLTAFVDPAFYTVYSQPELPELIKEAQLNRNAEELKSWHMKAVAEGDDQRKWGTEDWTDKDWEMVSGCCVQIYFEPEEKRMVQADVVCKLPFGDIYSFTIGAGLSFATSDLHLNVPLARLERMRDSANHEQHHLSQSDFDRATDGHYADGHAYDRNKTMKAWNYTEGHVDSDSSKSMLEIGTAGPSAVLFTV